jgi:hypothetical protein
MGTRLALVALLALACATARPAPPPQQEPVEQADDLKEVEQLLTEAVALINAKEFAVAQPKLDAILADPIFPELTDEVRHDVLYRKGYVAWNLKDGAQARDYALRAAATQATSVADYTLRISADLLLGDARDRAQAVIDWARRSKNVNGHLGDNYIVSADNAAKDLSGEFRRELASIGGYATKRSGSIAAELE